MPKVCYYIGFNANRVAALMSPELLCIENDPGSMSNSRNRNA